MTRQWLADPEKMCRQHLLGEHFETHIFVSKMEKGYSLEGFRKSSMFFGAEFIKQRHDLLTKFIKGHKTPLEITDNLIEKYPLIQPNWDNTLKSLDDLLGRCEKCRNLYLAPVAQ